MGRNRKPVPCPYNEWVDCMHTADCENCGWNPDVEAKRTQAIREELGLETEE